MQVCLAYLLVSLPIYKIQLTLWNLDHCIELIRQVLVCHGDVTVVTYDWLHDDPIPMPRWEVEHECVDWNELDAWALNRRVSVSEEGMIVHPDLGASYPVMQERAN